MKAKKYQSLRPAKLWHLRRKKKRVDGMHDMKYTPEELEQAAIEYFDWVSENTVTAAEIIRTKEGANLYEIPKLRPMTWSGFWVWLNICNQTWYNYCDNPEYQNVTQWIRYILEDWQLTGGQTGLLEKNLVARQIGMKERTENDHNIDGGLKVEIIKFGKDTTSE